MASKDTEKTLVVPINVQAICIGTDDANQPAFIKPKADFSLLPYREGNQTFNTYANVSEHILNNPFDSDRHAMRQGIHLHWALPDAFTHAEIRNTISLSDLQETYPKHGQIIWKALLSNQWLSPIPTSGTTSIKSGDVKEAHINDISLLPEKQQVLGGPLADHTDQIRMFLEQYQMNFPNVPNRWMVTRICYSEDGGSFKKVTSHRSWVVESDYLSSEDYNKGVRKDNTTVPFESPASSKPYRYMGERFESGLWIPDSADEYYSKLTAVGYGDISFAGYYPNCSSVFGFHDDLSDIAESYDAITYQVSGWFSDLDNSKDPFNKTTDFQSVIDDFNWQLISSSTSKGPLEINRSVYAGMVSHIKFDPSEDYLSKEKPLENVNVALAMNEKEGLAALTTTGVTQKLFCAWQMGIERLLDSPEGIFKVENKIHDNRFMKTEGGQLWKVIQPESTGDSSPPDGEKILPKDIADRLNALNLNQQSFNQKAAEIRSMRERIFCDWYKYMVKKYDQVLLQELDPSNVDLTTSQIRQFIEETDIPALSDLIGGDEGLGSIGQTLVNQRTELLTTLKNTTYILERTPAPVFYQGNNPMILLKSDQSNWQYAGDRNGDFNSTEKLICRLASDILPNKNTDALLVDMNGDLSKLLSSFISDIITPLINEAVVFSASTYKTVEDGQHSGELPAKIAVTEWVGKNSWLVMQLHWSLAFKSFTPFQKSTYDSNYVTDYFVFDQNQSELKLNWAKVTNDQFDNPETFSGSCLLSPHIKSNTAVQIDRTIESYTTNQKLVGQFETLKETVAGSNILSQALTGFNDALIMKKQTLQLKVNDPLRAAFDGSFNSKSQAAVSDQNRLAPLPHNPYHPIRTGLVKVDKVRLVDVFGRFEGVDVDETVYPDEMTVSQIDGFTATLPLRIAQESRLMYDYLSADKIEDSLAPETITYTGTSPVCGWIVLNILESAFVIYNSDGMPLGSLRTNTEDDTMIWHSPPGVSGSNNDINHDMANANEYLQQFVMSVYEKGITSFEYFLQCLEASQPTIETNAYRQDRGLAPLIGEPIALVRAMIDFQIKGLPELDQTWSALSTDIKQGDAMDRSDRDFTNVKFPLQVGTPDRQTDGLYGFFTEDSTMGAFGIFHSNYAPQNTAYLDNDTQVKVTLSDGPIIVPMLVQPSNPVYLNSGILPEQFVELPLEYYVEAINNIYVTFLTAPILVDQDELRVPLSKEKGREWSFIHKEGAHWEETMDDILDASNEATFMVSQRKIVEGWLQLKKESKT